MRLPGPRFESLEHEVGRRYIGSVNLLYGSIKNEYYIDHCIGYARSRGF